MLALLRVKPLLNEETQEYVEEAFRGILRGSVIALGAVYLGWAYLLAASQPVRFLGPVMLLTLPVLLTGALTLWLVTTRPRLAQGIFFAGAALSVLMGLQLLREPRALLLLALLPLVGAVGGGLRAALPAIALATTGALLPGLRPDLFPITASDQVAVILLAGLAGGLGGAAVDALLALVVRSYQETRQARLQMEESRQQRLELFQVRDDLMLANNELARLSDRLRAMTEEAEDARRVKEEFVANVSHELRTPLNMIIGFSELIAKAPHTYGSLPPALLADIAAIQRNSQHLSELVNDVLDLSQAEAGRMTLTKDWTTLQELAEAAIGATKVLFDTKGLYLKAALPEEPLPLHCDRTRIREVLLNLLSNAGRFTDQGGVTLSAERSGGMLVVCITDTGPGIAAGDQQRLFEPFQQLDNSIRRKGGSGLGLSISKRFVEMHGGRMWLESRPAEGSSFFFSLPLSQPPAGAFGPAGTAATTAQRWVTPYHQPEVAPRRSKAPPPVVRPRFVLLDRGDALERMFNRQFDDVEIENVDDLDGAIAALARLPSQALVINRATTGISAVRVREIERIPYDTPVMVCRVAGDDTAARRLGVGAYLLKPVSRDRLLKSLSALGGGIHTVLVVDDDIEVLQLFARILQSSGKDYVVLRARDGRQALEILRERRPDVVLMDLVMPVMDGFQVLREKQQDESIRDIPVIVLSSKDPTGAPIVSESLTVARKGGLSTREMLVCVRALSEILAPGKPPGGRAQKGSLPD
jgi:signal transduction histidine kinase/CheY-like chemotaxis protein